MKRSTQNIEQLLKQAMAEGESVGQGVITISTEKALEKVREFGFADESHWVLAFVQAGVAGSVQRIEFSEERYLRRATLVGAPEGTLTELAPHLMAMEPITNPSLEALRRSIWGLLKGGHLLLTQGAQQVAWNGEEIRHMERVDDGSRDFQIVMENRRSWVHQNSWIVSEVNRSRAVADHLSILKERAIYCPIPIFFDGLKLEAPPDKELAGGLHTPFLLTEGTLECVESSRLEFGPTEESWIDLVKSKKMLLPTVSVPGPIELRFLYSFGSRQFDEVERDKQTGKSSTVSRVTYDALNLKSSIVWIKHGVVIATESCRTGSVAVRMLVRNDKRPTDLTGLARRDDRESDERVRGCLEANWQKLRLELLAHLAKILGLESLYVRLDGRMNKTTAGFWSRISTAFYCGLLAAGAVVLMLDSQGPALAMGGVTFLCSLTWGKGNEMTATNQAMAPLVDRIQSEGRFVTNPGDWRSES